MLLSWSKQQKKEKERGKRDPNPDSDSLRIVVSNLENSVTQLALSVISAAGFGHKVQWPGHEQTDSGAEGSEVTFAECLKTFVDEIFVLFIFPSWFLRLSPSAHLRNIHKAPGIFANHVKQAIEHARLRENNETRENDLLSNMVHTRSHSSDSDPALSDEEITGNVFIYTLAGHETTATTIQTALILLALHPDLQQEIQEELDLIYASKSEGREGPLAYESDYPRMRHAMALMVCNPSVYYHK
jgi:cytochrome P450